MDATSPTPAPKSSDAVEAEAPAAGETAAVADPASEPAAAGDIVLPGAAARLKGRLVSRLPLVLGAVGVICIVAGGLFLVFSASSSTVSSQGVSLNVFSATRQATWDEGSNGSVYHTRDAADEFVVVKADVSSADAGHAVMEWDSVTITDENGRVSQPSITMTSTSTPKSGGSPTTTVAWIVVVSKSAHALKLNLPGGAIVNLASLPTGGLPIVAIVLIVAGVALLIAALIVFLVRRRRLAPQEALNVPPTLPEGAEAPTAEAPTAEAPTAEA